MTDVDANLIHESAHVLVDGTLKREDRGITARCECGWVSGGHFSSLAASAAFMDHQEKCAALRAREAQP